MAYKESRIDQQSTATRRSLRRQQPQDVRPESSKKLNSKAPPPHASTARPWPNLRRRHAWQCHPRGRTGGAGAEAAGTQEGRHRGRRAPAPPCPLPCPLRACAARLPHEFLGCSAAPGGVCAWAGAACNRAEDNGGRPGHGGVQPLACAAGGISRRVTPSLAPSKHPFGPHGGRQAYGKETVSYQQVSPHRSTSGSRASRRERTSVTVDGDARGGAQPGAGGSGSVWIGVDRSGPPLDRCASALSPVWGPWPPRGGSRGGLPRPVEFFAGPPWRWIGVDRCGAPWPGGGSVWIDVDRCGSPWTGRGSVWIGLDRVVDWRGAPQPRPMEFCRRVRGFFAEARESFLPARPGGGSVWIGVGRPGPGGGSVWIGVGRPGPGSGSVRIGVDRCGSPRPGGRPGARGALPAARAGPRLGGRGRTCCPTAARANAPAFIRIACANTSAILPAHVRARTQGGGAALWKFFQNFLRRRTGAHRGGATRCGPPPLPPPRNHP